MKRPWNYANFTQKGKRLYCALVLCSWLLQAQTLSAGSMPAGSESLVTLEIVYAMPEAGEVFLVWGVNGWGILPAELRPADTVVKDSLMYTPMEKRRGIFSAKIRPPRGATVDYVFQITKRHDGGEVSVWDTNSSRDYHATASRDGKYSSGGKTLEEEAGSHEDADTGMHLLAVAGIILLFSAILIRAIRRRQLQTSDNHALKVFCAGISLYFFLVVIRSQVMGYGGESFFSPLSIP